MSRGKFIANLWDASLSEEDFDEHIVFFSGSDHNLVRVDFFREFVFHRGGTVAETLGTRDACYGIVGRVYGDASVDVGLIAEDTGSYFDEAVFSELTVFFWEFAIFVFCGKTDYIVAAVKWFREEYTFR
jgi:hypothetical protein